MPVLPVLRGRQVRAGLRSFRLAYRSLARQSHRPGQAELHGDAFRARPQGRREGNAAQLDSGRRAYG